MTKGILGKKLGMTQVFSENGEVVPVTVIEVEPNVVLQKKSVENDGYESVQLGFADKKESQINKPEKGHAEKANATPKRFVKEFRNLDATNLEVGQEVKVDTFESGDAIDVTGITKGKGFAGAIKRHNQSRGPMTHGSRYHRRPGAMGPIDPNHVRPGKKLPGRMGTNQVTIQNLEVVKVDTDRNLLLVKGNVPGAKRSYVSVHSAVKEN
ncbi:50S ribosomal protein L3 [Texcoconibacillus texcoconensis]|uniref:Large ribosomal subunit protein uL3 n=1 Tax=Texcoconibacillus texcoconensis TaxID=1095777 RepID=A0A840QTV9_9BACI|nr:50S ribosomal protein L3 [Texcoconibacillus texcoconensis]MBB5174986.1 large subunit ribosomal protein L3 [Texcoconibacillus texcoconensis]